jgi:spore coat polysaccharide biosynthesis protein SpsF
MITLAIIQARMGSTRLPGKVMADIAGAPMLTRVVSRTARATSVDRVVVATTTEPVDDQLVAMCIHQGWDVFRGSQHDLLDRYYQAALLYRADVVVRITSDCPFIDPEIIDQVVGSLSTSSTRADYASSTILPRTFPRGLDTEAMTFAALERAWKQDADPMLREHVTPYIYQHPEQFALTRVDNETDLSAHRWTVDTAEDLALVRRIYDSFTDDYFSWRDVLRLVEEHPDWEDINRGIEQKSL